MMKVQITFSLDDRDRYLIGNEMFTIGRASHKSCEYWISGVVLNKLTKLKEKADEEEKPL